MNTILLTVWALLVTFFLALLAYRGQLSRYEEDQLFLGDEPNKEQEFQSRLVGRLRRIEPFIRVSGGAAALATVCAIGTYVWAAWQNIQ